MPIAEVEQFLRNQDIFLINQREIKVGKTMLLAADPSHFTPIDCIILEVDTSRSMGETDIYPRTIRISYCNGKYELWTSPSFLFPVYHLFTSIVS